MTMSPPRPRKGGWTYSIAVMKVSQTEPTTLERFRRAVGCGVVQGPYAPPKNGLSKRQRWEFATQGKAAFAAAEKLMPYLSEPKRQQVRAAIQATAAVAAERRDGITARQAPPDVDLLNRLYRDEGLSIAECAAALGRSASTLQRWMERTGYGRRNSGEGRWATARRHHRPSPSPPAPHEPENSSAMCMPQ